MEGEFTRFVAGGLIARDGCPARVCDLTRTGRTRRVRDPTDGADGLPRVVQSNTPSSIVT